MNFNKNALQHKIDEFSRENIELKKDILKFNNSSRIEIFLWCLEIFIHLQNILKDKIVLKGGAAAQFYLPVENQRTSIDIDIIVNASEEEIKKAINVIEGIFNGQDDMIKFRPLKPKSPKTNLPLRTFFIYIPSVLTRDGFQQIKCEFMFSKRIEINKIKSPRLFSCNTNLAYNVLPINFLLADKLTTLGPNTIGIQDDRSDEQIKQLYDIIELIEQNLNRLNIVQIKEYYEYRALEESNIRGIDYCFDFFIKDAISFLNRYRFLDIYKEKALEKQINDFQGLYLRKNVRRTNAKWAIVSRKLSLFLNIIKSNKLDFELFKLANKISENILFREFSGLEKSRKVNRIKNKMIENFSRNSDVPENILKGKSPERIFWEILTLDNIKFVNKILNY